MTKKTKAVLTSKSGPFNWDRRLRRSNESLTRKSEDGSLVVLLMNREDVCFEIHGIAATVWNQFDGRRSLGQILSSVCEKFETDRDQLETQVQRFIQKLVTYHLVQ
jgi:hypothetical protein